MAIKKNDMPLAGYGIDYGTTNSTIANEKDETVERLPIDKGSLNPNVFRSIVYVNEKHEFLYGQSAVEAYGKDVKSGKGRVKKTVYTGRLITISGQADIHGVKPDELVEELIEFDEFQGGRMLQSLKSVLSDESVKGINLYGKIFTLEDIIGGFLSEMKKRADKITGKSVDYAVIGRPVRYVGGKSKVAIKRMQSAAKIAGFKNVVFEYEPVAAAYDYEKKIKKPQTALIFDFGGGTLDVSVVRFPEKKVLANTGLAIGGDYFNSKIFGKNISKFFGSETTYGPKKMFMPAFIYQALRSWYSATLLKDEGWDEQMDHFRFMSSDPVSIDALRSLVNNNLSFALYDGIDNVKIRLSDRNEDMFSFIEDHINIKSLIKKSDFENLIHEDIHRINTLLDEAVKDAGINAEDIDAVATTGGSSLVPIVRKLLTDKFSQEKIIPNDAFTSVSAGLAIRAKEIFS